ncbi:MAG: hypothetical protein JXL97_14140 [Bacteroidales bacterium]|nr:hypothetical protein [Bacteroidales bacterium]
MFLKLLLVTIAILGLVFLGLGVQTFFSKKKSFPQTRISKNKEMRKRKIYCGETQQKMIDKGLDGGSGCNNCG